MVFDPFEIPCEIWELIFLQLDFSEQTKCLRVCTIWQKILLELPTTYDLEPNRAYSNAVRDLLRIRKRDSLNLDPELARAYTREVADFYSCIRSRKLVITSSTCPILSLPPTQPTRSLVPPKVGSSFTFPNLKNLTHIVVSKIAVVGLDIESVIEFVVDHKTPLLEVKNCIVQQKFIGCFKLPPDGTPKSHLTQTTSIKLWLWKYSPATSVVRRLFWNMMSTSLRMPFSSEDLTQIQKYIDDGILNNGALRKSISEIQDTSRLFQEDLTKFELKNLEHLSCWCLLIAGRSLFGSSDVR